MIKIIEPIKKDYEEIYLRALSRTIEDRQTDDRTRLKRFIYYSVKFITAARPDTKQIIEMAKLIEHTMRSIEVLTPEEFITMFPIEKCYDGERCGMKDYFYTMDYLKKRGMKQAIGEGVIEFLWEYMNRDTRRFCLAAMNLMEESNRRLGNPVQNVFQWMNIPTYTTFKSGGKEYLKNKATGEIKRIHRPRRLHLEPPYKM